MYQLHKGVWEGLCGDAAWWTAANQQLRSLDPFLPTGPHSQPGSSTCGTGSFVLQGFFFFSKFYAFLQIELSKDELTALNYLTRFLFYKGR